MNSQTTGRFCFTRSQVRWLPVGLAALLLAACGDGTPGSPQISGVAPASVAVGTAYSFTPTASDPNGSTLTFSIQNKPPWLGFSTSTGQLSGTPAAADVGTYPNIIISVSDGTTTVALASFALTVTTGANPAPTIAGVPAHSIAVGSAYSFTPTASDPNGNTLTFSIQNKPAWLSFSTSTGQLSGTPAAGNVGPYPNIVISVSDGTTNVALAPFTLTVNAQTSTLKITTTGLPNGVVASPYSATVKASGGTAPYAWTVLSGQLPAGLSLSGPSGAISGTPTTAGTASFTVSLHDATGAATTLAVDITISGTVAAAPFGHVVLVMEENTDYSSVVDNPATMPYLSSLIGNYGLATQYYADTHPSIGNYMMLVTGQVLTNDDNQTPASFPVATDNVVRQLVTNGKTWKAYSEDLPSVGYTGGDTADYAVRHAPLAYLTDVQNSASEKLNLVPFTQFATDLASGQLPNYSFVTPNLCDDGHDCGLDVADTWLQTNIEPLLADETFKKDGLLLVVFDESDGDNTHGGGRVVAVIVSPAFSKTGYQSTNLYQHESTLRLMLEGLGIKSLPGAAATAPPMWEFFNFPPPP